MAMAFLDFDLWSSCHIHFFDFGWQHTRHIHRNKSSSMRNVKKFAIYRPLVPSSLCFVTNFTSVVNQNSTMGFPCSLDTAKADASVHLFSFLCIELGKNDAKRSARYHRRFALRVQRNPWGESKRAMDPKKSIGNSTRRHIKWLDGNNHRSPLPSFNCAKNEMKVRCVLCHVHR